jgi:dTDP-4-dehydrorhamnose reductase
MLGRAWASKLARIGARFDAPGLDSLDLTKESTIRPIGAGPWRLVINCAGWTDVDGAETHEALATTINGTGVGQLAHACARSGALLVHYSTDYVFDGSARRPYATGHPRRPVNAYGRSKALGEELLEASGCARLLIRTSWLYAPWGKNFVRTIHKLVSERPEIKVVNDQRGRPTCAEHLARATARLIAAGATGILHVTDGGECSWHEFAGEIAAATPGAGRVLPCSSREFPRPAARPAYSVLDLTETERLIGPMPDWRENVRAVLSRLEP